VAQGAQEWSIKLSGGPSLKLHEEVHLSAPDQAIYAFDATSQELIGTLTDPERVAS